MRYPKLTCSNLPQVVGRDRARHRVLLGGLGCMGVGQMWFDDVERFVDGRVAYDNANRPGFDDAPEVQEKP